MLHMATGPHHHTCKRAHTHTHVHTLLHPAHPHTPLCPHSHTPSTVPGLSAGLRGGADGRGQGRDGSLGCPLLPGMPSAPPNTLSSPRTPRIPRTPPPPHDAPPPWNTLSSQEPPPPQDAPASQSLCPPRDAPILPRVPLLPGTLCTPRTLCPPERPLLPWMQRVTSCPSCGQDGLQQPESLNPHLPSPQASGDHRTACSVTRWPVHGESLYPQPYLWINESRRASNRLGEAGDWCVSVGTRCDTCEPHLCLQQQRLPLWMKR